jgi:hypothetical protein
MKECKDFQKVFSYRPDYSAFSKWRYLFHLGTHVRERESERERETDRQTD